jgi:hypothetical protein
MRRRVSSARRAGSDDRYGVDFHQEQWCSVQRCGTRAKVRAHRARSRIAAAVGQAPDPPDKT